MNRSLVLFRKVPVRQFSTSNIKYIKPDMSKIKMKQELFQAENDTPVYLKGGSMDHFLYYTVVIGTVLVTGLAFNSLYLNCNRNKK